MQAYGFIYRDWYTTAQERSGMVKTQRLIVILKLLEKGERLTVPQMANLLGMTERTIWRDMAELRELEVPMKLNDGRYSIDRQRFASWEKATVGQRIEKVSRDSKAL